MTAEEKDATKLLEQLISECEGPPNRHAWVKCKRCLAMHLLENKDPLAVRLLRAAIERLKQ